MVYGLLRDIASVTAGQPAVSKFDLQICRLFAVFLQRELFSS